jgi:hypothetical protein
VKLTDHLPRPVAWFTRVVLYGLAAVIVLAQCTTIGKFGQLKSMSQCAEDPALKDAQSKTALLRTQALVNCLEKQNNFLENLVQWPLRRTIRSLPNAPAEYVGAWVSSQPECAYCIRFGADGEFRAEPIACKINAEAFSGSWGVNKNRMIWMYDSGKVWPPDINAIEERAADRFVLVEGNQSRTQFRRADAAAGECAPPPASSAAAPAEKAGDADGPAEDRTGSPAGGPAANWASEIRVPTVAPVSDADRAMLEVAREVTTIELAVDAAAAMCRQKAPQQAATVQLAKDRWRREHAGPIARKNAFLRNQAATEDAARFLEEGRAAADAMLSPIGRGSADALAAWCRDAAQTFESGRFALKAEMEGSGPRPDPAGGR